MQNKKRIVLVEDDQNLGFVIQDSLRAHNYEVDWAKTGQEGLKLILNNEYHIAILDVMLPHISGFEIAEEIIETKPELPFLFVTAKAMIEDKLRGLKLGEDYITKPFAFEELKIRVEKILSRANVSQPDDLNDFTIGLYEFDYINQYLTKDGETQKLTKREADVLKQLAINVNQVMNREDALRKIWGNNDYFNGRSMDVFISRIRKYLKDDPNIQIINIHGVGFKMAVK
ncbi:MAG: DNA-binding response regulator [Bacteroidetes bacterium]|nr:MAG: DNA-binding response regulator [Bacteroidota bacterium]MBL1144414.1 DNA-binding response regulator [Bacteroidota bacterium]MCB0803563.1 response regulator transcription factor [Flavobacteriales bacterium]NOG57208.1 response regulator transcription factor [Bacteroidota bacterium]